MIETLRAENPEKYTAALEFIEDLPLADWPGGPVDAKDGRIHVGLINPTLLPRGTAGLDIAQYRADAIQDLKYGDPTKARALVNALAEGLKDEWPDADKAAVDKFAATVTQMQEVLGS